jgi:hypothetical protein
MRQILEEAEDVVDHKFRLGASDVVVTTVNDVRVARQRG